MSFAAAALLFSAMPPIARAPAAGGDRTISFYNMHTKETLTVTYMKNGRHDPAALTRINQILRDWRRNESIRMDPDLIDLVYDIHRELGSNEPVHIVSGYRSPVTNANLRRRGRGVAKYSQHMLGKAMDLYFPDVPLEKIREVGLRHEGGGVGYYPTSGRPFVHIDTGSVRHWPRMTRQQLARVFPDGNTRHVPADGKPLTRTVTTQDVQVASLETKSGGKPQPELRTAYAAPTPAIASDPARDVIRRRGSFEIPLLSAGRSEEETAPAAPQRQQKPFVLASLQPAGQPVAAAPAKPEFVPPIPARRPPYALDGEYRESLDVIVTASLPDAPLPPRRPDFASPFALAAAPAPAPRAVAGQLSGGMTYQLAALNPYVAAQSVVSSRFAVLVAPDQANLGALVRAPERALSISFAARQPDQPSAQYFSGPAIQPLRVAVFSPPYRTAAR